ncbi:MAG: site-specific DNA-methyltransferase, partial [Myxococcota bacterium]
MRVSHEPEGSRIGFGGKRYRTETLASPEYADRRDDFVGFLLPRIEASLRCLTEDGSLFVHLDTR